MSFFFSLTSKWLKKIYTAQCYTPAWIGGGFGAEWRHVHVWLSPLAVHGKLSQHCLSAISQYKIKFKAEKQTTQKKIYTGYPKW